jgi:hypothetical protein
MEGVGFGDDHDHRKPHSVSAAHTLEQGTSDRSEVSEASVAALKSKDAWTLRVRLQQEGRRRDLTRCVGPILAAITAPQLPQR